MGFAEQGRRVVFLRPESENCGRPPLDPAAQLGHNIYRTDPAQSPLSYDQLTPASSPAGEYDQPSYGNANGFLAGGSADLSHIVYASSAAQTGDAPAGTFDKIFDWEEGTLSLVSVDASGNPLTTAADITAG